MANRVYTFTAMNKEGGHYFELLKSAFVWGWGMKAHFFPDEEADDIIFSHSYMKWMKRKHLIIKDIILSAMKKEYNRFLYVDAWDAIFCGPPSELQFPDTLNFGVEGPGAYPDEEYTPFFRPNACLNAGVIWGSCAGYIQRCPNYEEFDQRVWIREYMNDQMGIFLDETRRFSVNLYGHSNESDWGWDKGRVVWTKTGSKPLILHANGKWGFPRLALAQLAAGHPPKNVDPEVARMELER